MKIHTPSGYNRALFLVLAAASLLYIASMDAKKLGFYHDDGIYAVTGKSIAQGAGYRIESLPAEPLQTKYPPFYPLILSGVWLLFPNFPSNAAALLAPSLLTTIGCLFIARKYLQEYLSATPGIALLAVALAAFNWRTVIIASSALSEASYTFFSVAAIWATESYLKKPALRNALAAALLLSVAILTRTTGISLAASIFLFALFRRKLVRAAPILLAGVSVFLVWILWARAHVAATDNAAMVFYTSYPGDWREIVESANYLLVLARNAFMLIPMSIPMVSLGFGYGAVSSLHPQLFVPAIILLLLTFALMVCGFLRSIRIGLGLSHLYILCYLAVHVFWPYSAYDRFLMPLLPFFSFFLLNELKHRVVYLKSTADRPRSLFSRSAVLPLIGFAIMVTLICGNLKGIYRETMQSRRAFASRALLDERLAAWIRNNTRLTDVVLCYPDPRYYLMTERKTIAAASSMKTARHDTSSYLRQIRETGSGYVILNRDMDFEGFRADPLREATESVLRAFPDAFDPVFSYGTATIYRVNNPPGPASHGSDNRQRPVPPLSGTVLSGLPAGAGAKHD